MVASGWNRGLSASGIHEVGTVLGFLLLVAVTAALVAARAIPFFLAGMVVALLILVWRDKTPQETVAKNDATPLGLFLGALSRSDPLPIALLFFLAWAAVSAGWSLDSGETLTKAGLALAIASGAFLMMGWIATQAREPVARLADGLWIGLAIGLLYLLFELLTNQSLKIWLYNLIGLGVEDVKAKWYKFVDGRIIRIVEVDLTRNATPITLLLWPSLMAVLGTVARPAHVAMAVALFGLATYVVFLAPQETSKLALPAGALVFALSCISRQWIWRLLMVGWGVACLLILPIVMLAYQQNLHNAPWLQKSAQHRIVIWNYTAEETLKSPLIGIGAVSTYVLGQYVKPKVESAPGEAFERTTSQHAHNVFLQTWYELGAVGALLLLAMGIALITALSRLSSAVQPFAAATFASWTTIIAGSYGLWQTWFMALFALTVVAFACGARAFETRPLTTPGHAAPKAPPPP